MAALLDSTSREWWAMFSRLPHDLLPKVLGRMVDDEVKMLVHNASNQRLKADIQGVFAGIPMHAREPSSEHKDVLPFLVERPVAHAHVHMSSYGAYAVAALSYAHNVQDYVRGPRKEAANARKLQQRPLVIDINQQSLLLSPRAVDSPDAIPSSFSPSIGPIKGQALRGRVFDFKGMAQTPDDELLALARKYPDLYIPFERFTFDRHSTFAIEYKDPREVTSAPAMAEAGHATPLMLFPASQRRLTVTLPRPSRLGSDGASDASGCPKQFLDAAKLLYTKVHPTILRVCMPLGATAFELRGIVPVDSIRATNAAEMLAVCAGKSSALARALVDEGIARFHMKSAALQGKPSYNNNEPNQPDALGLPPVRDQLPGHVARMYHAQARSGAEEGPGSVAPAQRLELSGVRFNHLRTLVLLGAPDERLGVSQAVDEARGNDPRALPHYVPGFATNLWSVVLGHVDIHGEACLWSLLPQFSRDCPAYWVVLDRCRLLPANRRAHFDIERFDPQSPVVEAVAPISKCIQKMLLGFFGLSRINLLHVSSVDPTNFLASAAFFATLVEFQVQSDCLTRREVDALAVRSNAETECSSEDLLDSVGPRIGTWVLDLNGRAECALLVLASVRRLVEGDRYLFDHVERVEIVGLPSFDNAFDGRRHPPRNWDAELRTALRQVYWRFPHTNPLAATGAGREGKGVEK